MRRLAVISGKAKKATMMMVAGATVLTSLHLAASARISALRRQEGWLGLSSRPVDGVPGLLAVPGGEIPAAVARRDVIGSTSITVAGRRRIVVSIADRKLALLEDGRRVRTYPIAVGTAGSPSPEGEFVIVNRATDPVYRHGKKHILPGKDNPLGTRWMGLSLKGYGIHGTNVQGSVGKAASHGCFRMRRRDVEELYTLVQVGDAVTVRRERDAMIVQVFAAPGLNESGADTQIASAAISADAPAQQR